MIILKWTTNISIYNTVFLLLDNLFLSIGCAGVVVAQPMDTVKVNTAVMIFWGGEIEHFKKNLTWELTDGVPWVPEGLFFFAGKIKKEAKHFDVIL